MVMDCIRAYLTLLLKRMSLVMHPVNTHWHRFKHNTDKAMMPRLHWKGNQCGASVPPAFIEGISIYSRSCASMHPRHSAILGHQPPNLHIPVRSRISTSMYSRSCASMHPRHSAILGHQKTRHKPGFCFYLL
jgi:hypothetical protein